jgi:hypothetical protein
MLPPIGARSRRVNSISIDTTNIREEFGTLNMEVEDGRHKI